MNQNPAVDPNKANSNAFRPISGFSDFYVATNNGYANYNAVQATWARTKGRFDIALNYTYGKALGIVGFFNQFNINNNYGVLPGNRKQIFNAAYSIELGKPVKTKLAGGFVNGWQLSGITQIESGGNLTGNSGNQNFGFSPNGYRVDPTNPQSYGVSNVSLFGTPDIQLNPLVTCNPASGLGSHQYVNPNCFAIPTAPGQNGPTVLPAIYGPSFFNSDLALFKSFNITESKKIQFRIDGYNFLNHPLWSFNGNNLSLSYQGDPTKAGYGQLQNSAFGTVTQKQGHRVLQFVVKFLF
jgi:hypothetical protein